MSYYERPKEDWLWGGGWIYGGGGSIETFKEWAVKMFVLIVGAFFIAGFIYLLSH